MSNAAIIETLISNSRRLGKDAFHTAAAIHMVTGESYRPICIWCLEKLDLASDEEIDAHRTIDRSDNFCSCCDYVGPDVLVAKA